MKPHHHALPAEEDDCVVCEVRRFPLGLALDGIEFDTLALLHLHPDVRLHVVDAHQLFGRIVDAVRKGLGAAEGAPSDEAMAVLEAVFDGFHVETFLNVEEDIIGG